MTVQVLCSISIIFTCPGYWISQGISCGLESGHPGHALSFAGPYVLNSVSENLQKNVTNNHLQTLLADISIPADYAFSALETIHLLFNALYKCILVTVILISIN